MKVLIEDRDAQVYGMQPGYYEMAVDSMSYGPSGNILLHMARMGLNKCPIKVVVPPKGHAIVGASYFQLTTKEKHSSQTMSTRLDAKVEEFVVNMFGELEFKESFTDRRYVDDLTLHSAAVPGNILKGRLQMSVESVLKAMTRAMMGKPMHPPATGGPVSTEDPFLADKVFSKKAKLCLECKGTGTWMNPLNAAESDCSQGCKKP